MGYEGVGQVFGKQMKASLRCLVEIDEGRIACSVAVFGKIGMHKMPYIVVVDFSCLHCAQKEFSTHSVPEACHDRRHDSRKSVFPFVQDLMHTFCWR
jgi:hypothetical protein